MGSKKATPKKAEEPEQSTALTQIDTDSNEWLAALKEAGFVNAASGGATINRITPKGNLLYHGDDIIAEYSQRTKEPALYVQLTGMPVEYQSLFFDKRENASRAESNGLLAAAVGRDGTIPGTPSIEGRFCRSHFEVETEAREFAEDGTSCNTCPVHPFVPKEKLPPEAKGRKCSWRGDIEFRILTKQDDGTLAAEDETIYTMSLSTTGIIEFKGTGKNPLKGSASEKSTMARLAELGYKKWGREGLLKARTLLDLGGVICELRLPIQTSDDGSREWNTPSFNPIEIIEREEAPQLTSGDEPPASDSTFESDPVPF